MSLWTLVDGRPGEFIAHRTLQVRLHLLVLVLAVVVVLVVVLMVMLMVVLMVILMVVLVLQTNLAPFILWQTVKTLLSRFLSSTPDLTFTVSGQE